ncbi:MAG: cytochrome c oxidase subunit 3 [Acidobacteria bacterium]|nr:cytochrome c oxidase subunit 3 [Acidobacteriota bacterium]
MLALPPAPAPEPRRQLLVGTALACAAATALIGGMLALFLRFREAAMNSAEGLWLPKGTNVPLVPANVMLIALLPLCIFAQWAVYSAKRDDRPHTGAALFLVLLLGVALINAQAYIWTTMGLAANGGTYNIMFYAVTGVTTALAIVGVVFSAITAFRYLSGRDTDREVVAAHALYWYCFSAIFALVWFVVYVTK